MARLWQTSLSKDTHCANPSSPSKRLKTVAYVRAKAVKVQVLKFASSHDTFQDSCTIETGPWSHSLYGPSCFGNSFDWDSQPTKPTVPECNINEDMTFMYRFLPHIVPDANDPFNPFSVDYKKVRHFC